MAEIVASVPDELAAAAERMGDAGGGIDGMDERDGRDLMNG